MTTDKPSATVMRLIETFAKNLNNVRDLWNEIRIRGANEGFSERQLAEMVRPFLKERGLTANQIWYLFHRDEQRQRGKLQYEQLTPNIQMNDNKKELEDNSGTETSEVVNLERISNNTPVLTPDLEQFIEVEFDLALAKKDVLMPHLKASSNFAHYIVKARAKDGVLLSMEHEETNFTTYDYLYKIEIQGQKNQA